MQHHLDLTEITPTSGIKINRHGFRAKCLQRLMRLDAPVPRSVALSFDSVQALAEGEIPDVAPLIGIFGDAPLVSIRPSPENPEWGGPATVLDIGMNADRVAQLSEKIGGDAARKLYMRFIQTYAVDVARLEPELFPLPGVATEDALAEMLDTFEDEMDEPFPQTAAAQVSAVLRSMARGWGATSARLLRQAKGAPAEAPLGLVVQDMALGFGPDVSGSGVIQFVSPATGLKQITGRYLSQSQGREALKAKDGVMYLGRDKRGPSLEEAWPDGFADLVALGDRLRVGLREEMQIEFTIDASELRVLDAVRVTRTPRAAVRIAVALAEEGIIPQEDAVLRIEPRMLSELLHRQVDPEAPRDCLARGIAASPGAATGQVVFSANAAQAAAARGEDCILIRKETSPEDIRGMHAAKGILTERGGVTSHAAVIARGIGLPCVVGATGLSIDSRQKTMTAAGKVLKEGDTITLDGSSGQVLLGGVRQLEPMLDGAFRTLMTWADQARDIGVRANADTPEDAETARNFEAEGIGLCRTEHMFFAEHRLTVMREMILADRVEDRQAALDRLLPMQRQDFLALFETMQGRPVCIRLLDPPLHEFLPQTRDGIRALAEALNLSVTKISQRVEALSEFNPMLGLRGVRLGVTFPEIYDMQARAIFEATVLAAHKGAPVIPEIMIPLVSANREVELVKARIDAVAAAVRIEAGQDFTYKLGVMVETPRAAIKAGEIAEHCDFLSFGTNDLTQMTYGLSRDDAGRFMGAYVQAGIYPEDPFHTLDVDGVGELLHIAAERGRATKPGITLSVCGEHGGDPDSIDFCRKAGFTYVSCSPFRVPVARMAAAHLALTEEMPQEKPRRFNVLGRFLRATSQDD